MRETGNGIKNASPSIEREAKAKMLANMNFGENETFPNLTINEIRIRHGLQPIVDGDKKYVTKNK